MPKPSSWAHGFWTYNIRMIIFARQYVRQYSWPMRWTGAIFQLGISHFFKTREQKDRHRPVKDTASFGQPAGIPFMHFGLLMEAVEYRKSSLHTAFLFMREETSRQQEHSARRGVVTCNETIVAVREASRSCSIFYQCRFGCPMARGQTNSGLNRPARGKSP